jgi:sirohydrochlorin cobaltochelatase
MSDRCLILLPHGSRDPRWRRTLEELYADLAGELDPGRVRLAYQQFVSPTLLEVVADLYTAGVTLIDVLPMFIAVSEATERDVEAQVRAARAQFPAVQVRVLPPISEHPVFVEALTQIVRSAVAKGAGRCGRAARSSATRTGRC